jgi:hypothetical protein
MQQSMTGGLAPPADGTAPSPAARADAEEAQLLAQVVAGDRQAFERLYRGYFPG